MAGEAEGQEEGWRAGDGVKGGVGGKGKKSVRKGRGEVDGRLKVEAEVRGGGIKEK